LKKTDEISSTEKLLHVIRNRNETGLKESREAGDGFIDQEFKPSLYTIVPFKKKITLSIIVGSHDLMLVLISRISDQDWSLLDRKRVVFSPELKKDYKQFSVFLRSSIIHFLEGRKPDYIWSTIPSAKIETRFLAIPKVPSNQIPKVAYFSFNKINPANGEDLIFDFEILGEVSQGGAQKLQLFAYTAFSKEVENLRKLFTGIGLPLTGISIVPFAMQNLFRSKLLGNLPANICTLYVGKDWSRIDIFSKGNLVLSRDIKTGINSLVEAVKGRTERETLEDEPDNNHPDPEDRKFLENFFKDLSMPGVETDPGMRSGTLNHDGMLEMIIPVIRRLVRQVDRTFEHFSVNFDHEPIGKIFITGDLCAHPQIIDLISQQLNFDIDCIDPFSTGIVRMKKNQIPDTVAEKDSFAPAMGLAVSNLNRTPNLLYTYLQKGITSRIQKINQYVFITFLAVMSAGIGFFYWQDHAMKVRKDQIDRLHVQLESFSPLVEKKLILQMTSVLENERKENVSQAERSLGLVMLSELASRTPENIRLTKMDAQFFKDPSESKKNKLLLIEGAVFQRNTPPDADLAVYLIQLGKSPIFRQVSIREKSIQMLNGEKVLKFIAKLEPV
jgi:Tfp pilus assembly PilM family ATPase